MYKIGSFWFILQPFFLFLRIMSIRILTSRNIKHKIGMGKVLQVTQLLRYPPKGQELLISVQGRGTHGAGHIPLDLALPYSAIAVIFSIKSILLLILGHFFRFSPDHLLDICLGDNRSLAISILCFIFQNIGILSLTIMKKRGNGHYIHQDGHIWYCMAIFVARTFQAVPKHN